MSAPSNPPRGRGSSGRRASQPDPNMRVSHTERTEVADRLSKHYGDGRLDEEEFNDRLDRAMKAKTQADLSGLFDDLPGEEVPAGPVIRQQERPPRRRPFPRMVFLVLVVLAAIWVGQAIARPLLTFPFGGMGPWSFHIPWLLIAVVVFCWWRFARWHRS